MELAHYLPHISLQLFTSHQHPCRLSLWNYLFIKSENVGKFFILRLVLVNINFPYVVFIQKLPMVNSLNNRIWASRVQWTQCSNIIVLFVIIWMYFCDSGVMLVEIVWLSFAVAWIVMHYQTCPLDGIKEAILGKWKTTFNIFKLATVQGPLPP